MGIRESRHH
ncbi:hypothetical protein CP8484711_1510A, partial [Chlamydia psittaci 84-8471/1]